MNTIDKLMDLIESVEKRLAELEAKALPFWLAKHNMEIAMDRLEERVKKLEGLAYVTEVKQLDGTVTAEHDLVYRPEEHDVKRSGEKKWKPKDKELYFFIDLDDEVKETKAVVTNMHKYIDRGWNCFRNRDEAESFFAKIKKMREE